MGGKERVLVPSLRTSKVAGGDAHRATGSWELEVGIRSVAASMHCDYDACVQYIRDMFTRPTNADRGVHDSTPPLASLLGAGELCWSSTAKNHQVGCWRNTTDRSPAAPKG